MSDVATGGGIVISFDVVALTLSSVVDCDRPDCMVVVSIDSCWLGWSCFVVHKDAVVAAFEGTLDARFRN